MSMLQKTQLGSTQLKRSQQNGAGLQQLVDSQTNIEQLISRIQSTIIQTSESMKQRLQCFQQQQLINYKDDLLKTQDQFIKIRSQRNQDVIKNKIMKEKAKVEEKFSVQMKKSMEMNAKYQEMKCLVKKMNQEERQLVLEINYIKKKIELQNKQSLRLDQQIEEIKHSKPPKKLSKLDQERKLFTQLVNRCDQGNKPMNKKFKQDQTIKSISAQTHQKKVQKKLKHQISNLKDYIENIPLELNFVQNKLHQTILCKTTQLISHTNSSQQSNSQSRLSQQCNRESQGKENQLIQSSPKDQSVEQNHSNKLPSINNLKKSNKIETHQFTKNNSPKLPTFNNSIQTKSQSSKLSTKSQDDKKIPNIEQLPKSSALLEQILSDPQVKQYLYKVLFDGLIN